MVSYIGYIPPIGLQFSTNVGKYRKEKRFKYALIVVAIDSKSGNIRTLIESRFYHTKARSYNATWLYFGDFYTSGGSFASGYGVHLDSVALQYGLMDCGIGIDGLEGRGSHPMEDALLELAQKINDKHNLGYSNFTLISAHG